MTPSCQAPNMTHLYPSQRPIYFLRVFEFYPAGAMLFRVTGGGDAFELDLPCPLHYTPRKKT